ncbi:hypothetical protein ScPMuIL_003365 [Solemya velum]
MSDAQHKPGLYKWKRQSDSRTYSRSQKVTSTDDIQCWIKKVEMAANQAAEVTFQTSPRVPVSRNQGRTTALSTVQQLREHDQAMSEAQELLTQWMNDKVELDASDVDDDVRYRLGESDVKREWDHLLENNYEEYGIPSGSRSGKHRSSYTDDPYAGIYDTDESEAVSRILQHMSEKEVVPKNVVGDLGLEKWSTQKDPKMKMELRHLQVKERREKREAELRKKRQQLQDKKEALTKAKQIVLREEQDRQAKARQEELMVKNEMAKIRKVMQEDRKLYENAKLRVNLEKEVELAQSKLGQEQTEDERMRRGEELRRENQRLSQKKEQLKIRQVARNIRILRKHFSAWYDIVLERRLAVGKARAISDWKRMLRCWTAWRSYVRSKRLTQEAKKHEFDIIDSQRKGKMAVEHHHQSLLFRCFQSWSLFIQQEQERRSLEHAQHNTRNKMMAFLDAAATGKLWNSRQDSGRNAGKTTATKIDDMFHQPSRKVVSPCSTEESIDTDVLAGNKGGGDNHSSRVPREAWQVTRKHLNLTPEEIAQLSGERSEVTDLQVRRRFGTQPWMNRHYEINSFGNRHQAQKKILQDQQKQIKEQQRIIEELQFNQNHQQLQKQLVKQQQILQQLQEQQLSGQPVVLAPQTNVENEETEQHLNNLSHIKKSPGTLEKLQRNKVIRDKDTNITIDSARTESSNTCTSSRLAQQNSERTESASSTTSRSKVTPNSKYLSVLRNMENRAEQRAKAKADRENQRRIAEEQRLLEIKEHEEEMKRREEEEKRARVEAHKEKKKQEKLKEIEKRRFEQRMRELCRLADEHYLKSVMKYRGLLPMKTLVQQAKRNENRAEHHYQATLSKKVLLSWHKHTRHIVADKERVADEMFNYLLAKRCFNCWKVYKYHQLIMEEKAKKYHERWLKSRIINTWANYAMMMKNAYRGRTRKEPMNTISGS